MPTSRYCVRYIGKDAAEICNGEIYQAEELKDSRSLIGVLDRSGEWYAYPRELFVPTDNQELEGKGKRE